MRLILNLASAFYSTAKTQFLRVDRASERHYESRLDVCANCPGNHARFKASGELHTCGPMLVSLTRRGVPTCGCVLKLKARDTGQACPFGFWEQADAEARLAASRPAAVAMRAVGGFAGAALSRRGLVAGAAAGVAGVLGLGRGVRRAHANTDEADCYISVSPCREGTGSLVSCSSAEGMKEGDYVRGQAPGDSEADCYQITSVVPSQSDSVDPSRVVSGGGGDGCEEECACGEVFNTSDPDHPAPKVDVTISWSDNAAAGAQQVGDTWVINRFGIEGWESGQTYSLCPRSYVCSAYKGSSSAYYTEVWFGNAVVMAANSSMVAGLTDNQNHPINGNVVVHFPVFDRAGHAPYGGQFDTDDELEERRAAYINSGYPTPFTLDGEFLAAAGLAGKEIGSAHFQSITDPESSITMSWARGPGPWGCS